MSNISNTSENAIDAADYNRTGKPIPNDAIINIQVGNDKIPVDANITARGILDKVGVDPDKHCLQQIVKSGEKVDVALDDQINRTEITDAGFICVEVIPIIVNGTQHFVSQGYISFDELAMLAYPETPQSETRRYFIQYRNGPEENSTGSLASGKKVKIQSGMIFDVEPANKS